jgi:hypothetical protein
MIILIAILLFFIYMMGVIASLFYILLWNLELEVNKELNGVYSEISVFKIFYSWLFFLIKEKYQIK